MQPFQQRVVDELSDLEVKIQALSAFTLSDTFTTLEVDDRVTLLEQLRIMQQYAIILEKRISKF